MDKARFFKTPDSFRKWLARYSESRDELLVGYYKKDTEKPSITWPESVDEALCYGWIDGIRRRLDDESYSIRFTPRRPRSIWSARNIERVQVLLREKRMQPAGIRAYEKRTPERSGNYAYEQALVGFNEKYEAQFRKRKKAWAFFQSLPPSVRKPSIWWVCSARKEETRQSRLSKLIECCQKEERLPQFIRPANPRKKK